MATRSRTWWRHFSAAGVLFALASCSSEAIPTQQPFDDDEPGAVQGELAVYIADYDDGTTETRYFLRNAEGVEQRLRVSGEIDAAPGRKIKIWGAQRGEYLEVARYKVVDDISREGIGSQAQKAELVDATVKPGRVLCAALVNVNGGTAKTTLATVKNNFHDGATSVDNYYRENSFGQVGLEGDTYGPFTHMMSGCDYQGLASAIKPMIKAQNAACQQFAFVMGPNVSSCGWSGLGQVGNSDKPASDTWYNDSVSCVVAVQEPGHNYGMQHSSSITCSGGAFADDPSSCTHSEYGDKYDTMGGGCYHMNAWQKLYQKWFGGCNGVKATSSGKFNIYPIESPCNGIQVLQLPFPGGKTRSFQSTNLTSYYLELRTPVGFDSKYGAANVLIHVGAAPILPTTTGPRGSKTWVLNAGGGTWGLGAGKSYSDPAGGLTFTVESVSNAMATVNVEYASGTGTPVCLDGNNTPFTPPGPTDCGGPVITDASPPRPDVMADTGTGTGGTGGTGIDAAGGTGGTGTDAAGGASGAGMAGKGGTGGSTGGTGGTGGSTGGTGGSTGGTGGTGGDTGGSGGDTGGTGGDSGRGGASGRTNPEPLNSGCGCKVAGDDSAAGARGSLLLLGLAGLFGARRRKRS